MKYALLQDGDVIREGDEMLCPDCETWASVPLDGGTAIWQHWMVGAQYNVQLMMPHRRGVCELNERKEAQ